MQLTIPPTPIVRTFVLRKVKIDKLPKRTRKSVSKFEATPLWARTKKRLEMGFPETEALELFFSREAWLEMGLSPEPSPDRPTAAGIQAVSRFLTKYMRENALPYITKVRHNEDGTDTIIIRHPE